MSEDVHNSVTPVMHTIAVNRLLKSAREIYHKKSQWAEGI